MSPLLYERYAGMDRFAGAGLLGQLLPIDFGTLGLDAMAYLTRRCIVRRSSTVQYRTLHQGKWGGKIVGFITKSAGIAPKLHHPPPFESGPLPSLCTFPGNPGPLPKLAGSDTLAKGRMDVMSTA